MVVKVILIVAGVLVVGMLVFLKIRKALSERSIRDLVHRLYANPAPLRQVTESFSNLESLPDPVRRYFEAMLTEGRSAVMTARLGQTGRMRDDPESSQWLPSWRHNICAPGPPVFSGTPRCTPCRSSLSG